MRKMLIVLCFVLVTTNFALVIIDTSNTMCSEPEIIDYINERACSMGVVLEWQDFPYTGDPDVIIPIYVTDMFLPVEISWFDDWVYDGGTLVLPGEFNGFTIINRVFNNLLGPSGFGLPDSIYTCIARDTTCCFGTHNYWFTVVTHPIIDFIDRYDQFAVFACSYLNAGVGSNVMITLGAFAYAFSEVVGGKPVALQIPYGAGQILLFSDSNLIFNSSGVDEFWADYDNQDLFDRILLLGDDDIAESRQMPESPGITAYPNPFNSAVTISLSVIPGSIRPYGSSENPEIEIYDVNGRVVAEIPANYSVGNGSPVPSSGGRGDLVLTEIVWQPDATVGSGVYYIRTRFGGLSDRGDESVSKRVVYLK